MMYHLSNHSNAETLLDSVRQNLNGTMSEEALHESSQRLSEFAAAATDASQLELVRGAEMLSSVLELAACWRTQFPDEQELVEEAVQFVKEHLPLLQRDAHSPSQECHEGCTEIDAFVQIAQTKWNDYLGLIGDDVFQVDAWDRNSTSFDNIDTVDTEQRNEHVSNSEIALMLSAISATTIALDDVGREASVPDVFAEASDSAPQDPVVMFGMENDRELLEAYLDDAHRCLGSMEQAALAIEMSPGEKEPVQQFCRDLHTLKGASATVGLSELASYLHHLETSLAEMFADKSAMVEAEQLFAAIDRVRAVIGKLQSNTTSGLELEPVPESVSESLPAKSEFAGFASNEDSSIRIRAAKLDRLMDMLAELVVLRNRRENHVAEFNQFNDELSRCALRLRFAEDQQSCQIDVGGTNYSSGFHPRSGSSTFSEMGKDLSALALGFKELQKPLSNDNASISRFIRDFRQELMQLRRIPVSGLFHRLQRAARDAAKTEKKQVQIKLVGEHAGLEQEIQERLYESLLHVVRNSVSHGVETPDYRLKRGKHPVGTVTLKAYSSAQLLIIEVQDDGNGLDYVAVRKRAIEKGLLAPNQNTTHDELASLIFHPGFSTREQASEVAGRGFGMDIVSRTIDQLHGRIEVDSVGGQGTTIRLLIPLRSGIEHVMVFRSDGQLFALPLQSVTATKSSRANLGNLVRLSSSSTVSFEQANQTGSDDVLLLRQATDLGNGNLPSNSAGSITRLALAVDEMIGPEEVVVRGLPKLLKNHPLFCGVSLAGSGESVLLLDSDRVVEFCQRYQPSAVSSANQSVGSIAKKVALVNHALVVDDSLTARKMLCKLLHEHGFTTVEAGDGIEAIEHLHRAHFDLVLTDLDMPRLGGLELLSDIRSGQYCDVPVVVVSSRDDDTFRMKALDLGAAQYITKPISKKSIAQLVEHFQSMPATVKGN